jgi:hypothetical protein
VSGNVVDLWPDAQGKFPATIVPTGARHTLVVHVPTVVLDRRYHDDTPVARATFFIECTNGAVVTGTLDDQGRATVKLPAPPVQVTYSPDGREYQRVSKKQNPTFRGGEPVSDAATAALLVKYSSA